MFQGMDNTRLGEFCAEWLDSFTGACISSCPGPHSFLHLRAEAAARSLAIFPFPNPIRFSTPGPSFAMGPSISTPLLPSDFAPLAGGTSNEIHERHASPPTTALDKLDDSEANEDVDPKRSLGLYDGIALVLGLQIGSGIFASPSLVTRNAGSKPAALVIWCIAGALAWACAACYIELGTRLPVNGGPQEYLTYCFNDLFGFLASWACIFTVKPCSAAILALFISGYICDAFGFEENTFDFGKKLAALLIIALVATINRTGNKFSNIATKTALACKIFVVGFVIVAGLMTLIFSRDPASPSAAPFEPKPVLQPGLSNYTDATLSAMWAYSGWETLALVGGELKNPGRNTSLVINISMVVVIILSVLANMAYFSVLSVEEIVDTNTIGLVFCRHFLGQASGLLYALVICISTLGTLNIKIFTGARLTQAAAERSFLPPIIITVQREDCEPRREPEEVESRRGISGFLQRQTRYGDGSIPLSAILFNALLASGYILFGEFSALVIFIGIVEYSVAFLTLIGLLTLRFRHIPTEGNARRNIFHVPFPFILVASAATAIMVSISLVRHPIAGIGFLAFCVASAGIHTRFIRP